MGGSPEDPMDGIYRLSQSDMYMEFLEGKHQPQAPPPPISISSLLSCVDLNRPALCAANSGPGNVVFGSPVQGAGQPTRLKSSCTRGAPAGARTPPPEP